MVKGWYDIIEQTWTFRVDGRSYVFPYKGLPFPMTDYQAKIEDVIQHG